MFKNKSTNQLTIDYVLTTIYKISRLSLNFSERKIVWPKADFLEEAIRADGFEGENLTKELHSILSDCIYLGYIEEDIAYIGGTQFITGALELSANGVAIARGEVISPYEKMALKNSKQAFWVSITAIIVSILAMMATILKNELAH